MSEVIHYNPVYEDSVFLSLGTEAQAAKQGIIWRDVCCNSNYSPFRKFLSNISFGCYLYKEPKPILNNVYGNVKLGELTALMGPSGAGKSSLLKCLTNGISYSGYDGAIVSVGIKERIRASIIHQDEGEHLIPNLTIRETLVYASRMKNKKFCSGKDEHRKRVEILLRKLQLDNKANNKVLNCSGGERKRVAIGVELVEEPKPHILFLDEPTTGLDSSVAFSVVQSLKTFAEEGMAIVTTIHQPSKEILNQFHKAIILSSQGKIVFHGNPSESSLEHFFTKTIPNYSNSLEYKCFDNKSDVLIAIASSVKRGQDETTGDLINDALNPFFERLSVQQVCQKMIRQTENNYSLFPKAHARDYSYEGLLGRNKYPLISYFSLISFWTLLIRTCHLKLFLGKKSIILRLLIYLLVVFTTTHLYSREIGKDGGCILLRNENIFDPQNCTCIKSEKEIQGSETAAMSNIKLMFFLLLFLSLESLLNVTLTFPTEFKLFLREFENGWYSPLSYFIVKLLVEIPAQLIIPLAYTIYFYSYTQQPGSGIFTLLEEDDEGHRFQTFLSATYMSGFIAQGMGFLIGVLCVKSLSKSILVSSGTLLGFAFFSGFFKKKKMMSESQEYLSRGSFLRYGLETMLISIYGKGRCQHPKRAYALVAFGVDENDEWSNWVAFTVLIGATWGATLTILLMKASKWYALKRIRIVFNGLVKCFYWIIADYVDYLGKVDFKVCVWLRRLRKNKKVVYPLLVVIIIFSLGLPAFLVITSERNVAHSV